MERASEGAKGESYKRASDEDLPSRGEVELFDDRVRHDCAIVEGGKIKRKRKEIGNGKAAEAEPDVAGEAGVKMKTELAQAGAAKEFLKQPGEKKNDEAVDEPQADLRGHVVYRQAKQDCGGGFEEESDPKNFSEEEGSFFHDERCS